MVNHNLIMVEQGVAYQYKPPIHIRSTMYTNSLEISVPIWLVVKLLYNYWVPTDSFMFGLSRHGYCRRCLKADHQMGNWLILEHAGHP